MNDRKTYYGSKITNLQLHDDYIEYDEVFDLKHPNCPIAFKTKDILITEYKETKRSTKHHFELMFGLNNDL